MPHFGQAAGTGLPTPVHIGQTYAAPDLVTPADAVGAASA
jgi:hypothetical protein